MRLVIGSRASQLARLQAEQVGQALKQKHPSLEIQFHHRESLGDKLLNKPLAALPAKGVFTEDFLEDLIDGDLDLVVHSWKDLPIEEREKTVIAATLPRADMRDVLLLRRDIRLAQASQLRILSSSPRRAQNVGRFLKKAIPWKVSDVTFLNVRGNIPTRLKKLQAGEGEGLIVAKAALDRLLPAWPELKALLSTEFCWMVMPLREDPPAPGQGALAIEMRRDRADLKKLLDDINCLETFNAVIREREILRTFGGGCSLAIGAAALPRAYGSWHLVRGQAPSGEEIATEELSLSAPWAKEFPRTIKGHRVWPTAGTKVSALFRREPLSMSASDRKLLQTAKAVWIAKADAFKAANFAAEDFNDKVVWTGGLKTWARLAEMGVWVHGSSEGFGEEDPWLKGWGYNHTDFVKLTHLGAESMREQATIATYRLIPSTDHRLWVELEQAEICFWSSGSVFLEALKREPRIVEKCHGCGPGKTLETLLKNGIGKERIKVFIGGWLEKTSTSET